MSIGLESAVNGCGAKAEFFLSDKEGARQLRDYDFGHRIQNSFSVQIELTRPPHQSSQGEWVSVTGPQDNVEKAKVKEKKRLLSLSLPIVEVEYVVPYVCLHSGLLGVCQHVPAAIQLFLAVRYL